MGPNNHTHVFVDDDGDVAIIHHEHDESEHPHGQPDDISINQLLAAGALEQTILVSDLPDVNPDFSARRMILQEDDTLGLSLNRAYTIFNAATGQFQIEDSTSSLQIELGRTPDAYDLTGQLSPGASADSLIIYRWGYLISIIGGGCVEGTNDKLVALPAGFGIPDYQTFTGFDTSDKVVQGYAFNNELYLTSKNGGPWFFSFNALATDAWPSTFPPVVT